MPENVLKMSAGILCDQGKPFYWFIQSHPFITDPFLPSHLHHVLVIEQNESVTRGNVAQSWVNFVYVVC